MIGNPRASWLKQTAICCLAQEPPGWLDGSTADFPWAHSLVWLHGAGGWAGTRGPHSRVGSRWWSVTGAPWSPACGHSASSWLHQLLYMVVSGLQKLLFLNHFTEVFLTTLLRLTYKNLDVFNIHNSVSLGISVLPLNYHQHRGHNHT